MIHNLITGASKQDHRMPCQPEILGLSEQELSKRQEVDQKGILPVLKDGKEEHNQI